MRERNGRIQAFTHKSTRDERRELIKNFWQD